VVEVLEISLLLVERAVAELVLVATVRVEPLVP
jgi:hypothetical protein